LLFAAEGPFSTIADEEEPDLSEHHDDEFMKRFVAFINSPSEDLAAELVCADAIFHVPGRPEPLSGPAGYLTIIAMMRSGFPDVQWTLEETIRQGERIAARFTMRGTHQGHFMGVAPTGRTIAVQALNIYHLSNGRIIEEHGQPDLFGLLAQIGAVPV